MVWVVIYSKQASKDLLNIPKEVARDVVNTMDVVAIEPYKYLDKLRGYDLYKFRVGQHRVIIQLLNKKLIIHVVKVKHRSIVYKKLK